MKNTRRKIGITGLVLLSALSLSLIGFFAAVSIIFSGYNSASEHVSYLPGYDSLDRRLNYSNPVSEINGRWFSVSVDSKGEVSVKNKQGETIMQNLSFYSSHKESGEHYGLKNAVIDKVSDSTINITGEIAPGTYINMKLISHSVTPDLGIEITTEYNSEITVIREALIALFAVDVSEVFLKNSMSDTSDFSSEYWLNKEGVRFGKEDRSALIYHTPDVSSLQLDVENKALFVNLDYYSDHPFIRIPFQPDAGGRWTDSSPSSYIKGASRENRFKITFTSAPAKVPRLMLVPEGYLSAYVFTEHADGGNIRTNRAAYFGSEDITEADDATGGFVGNRIPVTKSVFYADPGDPPRSSIRDDPDFPQYKEFLLQLYKSGLYDICLHTPDSSNSDRSTLEESIKFMKETFNAKTWIDHGMYGGKINREAFVADGLDPESEFYAADLWVKYDTRYFWSPASEMIETYSLKKNLKNLKFHDVTMNLWKRYFSPEELSSTGFLKASRELLNRFRDDGELNSLKPNMGNAFPTPLFWKNPTISDEFYSWTTDYVKEYHELSPEKVNLEKELLRRLVENRGIFLNHGYFVDIERRDDIMEEQNGKITINPYFNQILRIMSEMRDSGDLSVTTVKELLDYWILTAQITFSYLPDGSIIVRNNSNESISGLSMVARGNSVFSDDVAPAVKKRGNEIIFWFDLPANTSARLTIE